MTESREIIQTTAAGVAIAVTVVPRSSCCEIAGIYNNTLRIKLTSPPVEGAANSQCIEVIAKQLGIAKKRVTIIQGKTSRRKILKIEGVKEDEVKKNLCEL